VAKFMSGFNVQVQCDGANLCSTRLISDLGRVLQQAATKEAATEEAATEADVEATKTVQVMVTETEAETAAKLRAAGKPTVPTTIAQELAANPFLRARDLAEFTARREAKNTFR
jgi:hypothetical protein